MIKQYDAIQSYLYLGEKTHTKQIVEVQYNMLLQETTTLSIF